MNLSEDDIAYFRERAQAELRQARVSTDDKAAAAHRAMAERYLTLVADDREADGD
jgi:hypothetical protein